MGRNISRFASALAVAAVLSMTAAPAMARGWGGGWGGGWHHRHRDHVDTGDVLAGLLIFGTVAAVASAASKADRPQRSSRDYRDVSDRDYREGSRYGDYRNDNRPGQSNYRGAGGIGNAVETCAGEVERSDRQIETIDSVDRDGEGWRVEGRVGNGTPFSCSVSDSGRIRAVSVDGHAA